MKKLLLVLIAFILGLSINTQAHDFYALNNEGYTIYYNIISSVSPYTVEVTYKGVYFYDDYNEYRGSVTIPDSVFYNNNYYKVISIGNGAFYECYELTSVSIPNTILYIGYSAFYGCNGLTSITIPNSVTSFGNSVFRHCFGLTSITIPNSVTDMGIETFADCVELTSITLSDSITSIGLNCFYNCSRLDSITIPSSVTLIDICAFYECSALTSVNIPNSVTSIGMGAFWNCGSLASISIPASITSIAPFAFEGTPFYNNMPDGVVYFNNILYSYKGIMPENTSITVQEGTKSICTNAFRFKSNLTSITIPNSVTSIGNNAFEDCSGLTSITIPNSVTTIEFSTFYNCTGLSSITIPNSVTCIKDRAFFGCTGLTSLTIGNSVTEIDYNAFGNCSGLTSITSLAETPPSLGVLVFDYVNKTIPLYVPEASIPLYQTVDGWQDFFNIQSLEIDDIRSENNVDILIYPNPAQDIAKISIDNLNSKAEIIIYDIMGKEVKREFISKGTKELMLDVSDLNRGVYNIRIVSETINQTKKLIVQ
ncbi:MAG: cell surface protein [Bacteroidetes bacterium]|nr:cell surface protein [Bacteroidota bacterium]